MSETLVRPALRVILPIQYLRGIAALMVVWRHSLDQVPGVEAVLPFHFGSSGVDLFFVISGFIMVVTTMGAPDMTAVEFARRRIVRVVPLYWILTLAMVAVAMVAPALFRTLQTSPLTLLQSLLFIPHFSHSFPGKVWPLLVPGWTLNFEMFFYLVFTLSLLFPPRGRLAAFTAAIIALVAAGYALGPFDGPAERTYTSPLLLEFLAGALIGAWWTRHRDGAPRPLSIALLVAGTPMLFLRDVEPLGIYTQIVGAALVVVGALNSSFSAWHNGVLRALGDASYSLYLTHVFTLGVLRIVWVRLVPVTTTVPEALAFVGLSMLLCSVVAHVAFKKLESPLLRKLMASTAPRCKTIESATAVAS